MPEAPFGPDFDPSNQARKSHAAARSASLAEALTTVIQE